MTRAEIEEQATDLPPTERGALALSLWETLSPEEQERLQQERLDSLRQEIQEGIADLEAGNATVLKESALESLASDIKARGRQRRASSR